MKNPTTPFLYDPAAGNLLVEVYDPIVVGQPQKFYRVVLTNCVL